ncbi:MAG: hypothetical protein ROR55_20170 [Devosia sp.]
MKKEQIRMPKEFTVIPGAEDDLRANIEQVKRQLPMFAELSEQVAAVRKASFDAHVEAGFSEEQALELCKSMSL